MKNPNEKLQVEYRVWAVKAVLHSLFGEAQQAIDSYRRALDLYDQEASTYVGTHYGPTLRRELGIMYSYLGDYGEALNWLRDVAAALEEIHVPEDKYQDELARIRSNAGLAYLELGEYQLAEEAFSEAIALHKGLKRYKQAAISHIGLGNALREHAQVQQSDYGSAIRAYKAALDTLDQLPGGTRDSKDRESDAQLELGYALILDNKPLEALDFLEKSLLLTSVSNIAQHAAVHYLYFGEAYTKLGNTLLAERFLRKAVVLAERYRTPQTKWRALHRYAVVQQADGHLLEHKATLEKCIEIIEQLRSQYLPESLKISMLSSKEKPYEDMVVLLCEFGMGEVENTDAEAVEEAFNYVEHVKSRVLMEQLSITDLGTTDLPADSLEEETELTRELKILQARHKVILEPQRYDWGEEVAEAENKLRTLRERLRESGPRGAEYVSLREASPLGYASIRRILHDAENDTAAPSTMKTQEAYANRVVLAEYFTTDEGTMLFIGRSDLEQPQLYQFDVSREDLWWWQHTFEDLAGDEPSSWDVDAWQYQLGRLTEPISTWSNEGDLVWIVPHRELHRLPLHALKIGDRYLIERNPVCYAPSASMMQFCRTKRTGRRQNALVVGDSLNDLSYARAEAHTVANLFNTEPLLGNRATKSTIKDHLNENRSGLDILHFACHGEYDFRVSLNSRIKLAPDTGNGSDGGDENPDLTAEEILGLEMQADLVTLSACESGVSEHRPGDELIGLTRSLIYAGTPSVLASLWSVHDRSTNILMKRFYDSLLSGTSYRGRPNMSKAYALQTAQRHVLSLTDFEHPYYWAPFVLVGDWS